MRERQQHEAKAQCKSYLKAGDQALLCSADDPFHLAALSHNLPFRRKPAWIISLVWPDVEEQKYRNDCVHCLQFEKRCPGKSSREQIKQKQNKFRTPL